MRKLLVSVAVATATLAAVPAAAQYHGDDRRWNRLPGQRDDRGGQSRPAIAGRPAAADPDLDQAEQRIDRSARRGIISQREALRPAPRGEPDRAPAPRASRNGLSGREFAELRVAGPTGSSSAAHERRDRDGRRF